uniref:Uncharacterized protein n=1 Tax=Arundo donax TaxID=35708 RepID=A0A0A9ESZ8_ARUDO
MRTTSRCRFVIAARGPYTPVRSISISGMPFNLLTSGYRVMEMIRFLVKMASLSIFNYLIFHYGTRA